MSWNLSNWNTQGRIGVFVDGAARIGAADEFLKSGRIETALGGTRCSSSTQCASGYKCVGGQCVPVQASGGTGGSGGTSSSGGFGGTSNCDGGPDGQDGGTSGTGGSGCSSPAPIGGGGSTGCTTTTCGQGTNAYGEDSDCCGERCCRYFATGIPSDPINVNCFCGPCPGTTGSPCGDGYPPCGPGLACINGKCTKVKPCNQFCSEYYAANGEDADGCSPEVRCDECTECAGTFEGGGHYCTEKENQPCHCDPDKLEECDICNSDGSTSPGVCLECCTIQNYDCGCGTAVTVEACRERGASGRSQCNLAQDAAAAKCAELCEIKPDPCAGICGTKTITGDGPCPENPTPPDADDGHTLTLRGCLESLGQHAIFYDDCDFSQAPEQCKQCDCNCHNDCKECELCNENCKCEPDPSCSENGISTWKLNIPSYTTYSINTVGCLAVNPTVVPAQEIVHTSQCGKLPHQLEETQPCIHIRGSVIINGCEIASTSPTSGAIIQAATYLILDADGNTIGSFVGNNPNGWSGGAHSSSTSPGCVQPVLDDFTYC